MKSETFNARAFFTARTDRLVPCRSDYANLTIQATKSESFRLALNPGFPFRRQNPERKACFSSRAPLCIPSFGYLGNSLASFPGSPLTLSLTEPDPIRRLVWLHGTTSPCHVPQVLVSAPSGGANDYAGFIVEEDIDSLLLEASQ